LLLYLKNSWFSLVLCSAVLNIHILT
jgi:hypothetical protein